MLRPRQRLPWTRETVPHGVLDIIRGCNVQCRDCYNTLAPSIKSLAEVEAELNVLLGKRKVHSISLVGGEITLHPHLCDIVRLISRKGIHLELFTNGVLLDGPLLRELKQAGADVLFLHIERGQQRADLPRNATAAQVEALRKEKCALVAEHGLDVALSITAYPHDTGEVLDAVRFTIQSPHVNHLLVTLWRDVRRMLSITGDLDGQLRGTDVAKPNGRSDTARNQAMMELLQSQLGFEPFAFLGSNLDPNDPRWISYLIGTAHERDGSTSFEWLRQSRFEPAFLRIHHALTGGYPFYQGQDAFRFKLHLLLNGITGGRLRRNLRLLWKCLRPGTTSAHKRLLFQCPANLDEQGRLVYCESCPDAVVKNGALVPLCISDRVQSPTNRNEVPCASS